MSAHSIFEHVPIVACSDGNPRPPERRRTKPDTWKTSDRQGRLIHRQGVPEIGTRDPYATFTLQETDRGGGRVFAMNGRLGDRCASSVMPATMPCSFASRRTVSRPKL